MNIETLKIFKDLVETKSFTRTASMNFISQSAVSQQIKKLELVFKTRLFIKKENDLELTDIGKILYDGASQILFIYEEMLSRIKKDFDSTLKGEIRISSIYTVGIYLLNYYIKEFLSKYQFIKISVDYYEWDEVVNKVLKGESDFGFIACKRVRDQNISLLHIVDEEMVFVAPYSFNKDSSERIDIKDAINPGLILFEKNTPSRKLVESFIKSKKLNFKITMELNNVETIKAAIRSNVGCSILPISSVKGDFDNKRLKIFRFKEPFYRPVFMIYNKRRQFPGVYGKFINFMLEQKKRGKTCCEEVYG